MLTVDRARHAIDRNWGRLIAILAGSTAEEWALPTRCPAWHVGSLVRHSVWGVTMETDALRRGRHGFSGRATGRLSGSDVPDVLLAELRSAVDGLTAEVAAIPAGTEDRTLPLPYGDVPATLALQLFVMEAGAHTDDLTSALGYDQPLDADVVEATASALGAVLPAMAAAAEAHPPAGTVVAVTGPSVDLRFALDGGHWVTAGPAEPTGAVVADDDTTALRFVLGRVRPDAPGLTTRGDRRVAAEFKRWFPGP
jgi:uncharacterized protein (TIGR03083 family)